MSARTGRFVVRRGGVVVPVKSIDWEHGVADGTSVAGLRATIAWAEQPTATGTRPAPWEPGWTSNEGTRVEVDWVEERHSPVRVLTGAIDTSDGRSLADPVSRIKDSTARLDRRMDLRPVAYTMPIHPELAGHGGLLRRVGLIGTYFTHQAMTTSGFDPGPWMHSSVVWFQNMCHSTWPVPDPRHPYRTLGDLRQSRDRVDPHAHPGFTQGDTQPCAINVFTFGVTNPRPVAVDTNDWQLTVDLGTRNLAAGAGEVLLRNLDTTAGVALQWTSSDVRVLRHNADNTRATLATYPRTTGGPVANDIRWSVAITPSGGMRVITDERGIIDTLSGTGVTLPGGDSARCTVRVDSPGLIGPVMVTRSNSHSIVTQKSTGRIYRAQSMTGRTLPGFDYVSDIPAGQVLAQQADAERGLCGQPIWQWINHDEHLINADFEYLAGRPNVHVLSTNPAGDEIPIDEVSWSTRANVRLAPSVEVIARRANPFIRSLPDILLATGNSETVQHGETIEQWLHPGQDEAWLDVDLYPLLAGRPYDPPLNTYLNYQTRSQVGGQILGEDSEGEETSWWADADDIDGWTSWGDGSTRGALEMLDPRTVVQRGTFIGGQQYSYSSMPYQNSVGLWEYRKTMPFAQLRGMGKLMFHDMLQVVEVPGVDFRHPPIRHDVGMWAQSATYVQRIAQSLAGEITNPTPVLTLTTALAPQVRPGEKVTAYEHRPTGHVVRTTGVVARVAGSSNADQMTIRVVATERATWMATTPADVTTETYGDHLPDVDPPTEGGSMPPERVGAINSTPEEIIP